MLILSNISCDCEDIDYDFVCEAVYSPVRVPAPKDATRGVYARLLRQASFSKLMFVGSLSFP